MKAIVARWTVRKELLHQTLTLLSELQKGSRLEPGNLSYDFYQDPAAPEKILIYEEYISDEAIAAHRMTRHFQEIAVRQIVPELLERSVKVFEIPS